MKISVGLLAYNSERWIAESAGCLQPYVDEVFVLIDKLTNDSTARILDEMKIPYAYREWNHNYADAKNALLDHLTGDWIIILDDDEKYSNEGARTLVETIKYFDTFVNSRIDGFEVNMKQHYPYWTTNEEDYLKEFGFNPHLSVFRKGYRFQNKVHESVPVPPQNRRMMVNGVFIHHHAWKGNREKYEAPKHNYYKDISEGKEVEHL